MKKTTGLLMIMILVLASCNTSSKDDNNVENETITTPTTEEGIKADEGSPYIEKTVKDNFRPIDVYIFIDGDEKSPIENAEILATSEGQEEQSLKTNKDGIATFNFVLDKSYKFTIDARKYTILKTDEIVKGNMKFGLKPKK